jgi:hypothetical protein
MGSAWRRGKAVVWVAAVVGVLAAVGGCGGGEPVGRPSPVDTPPTVTAPPATGSPTATPPEGTVRVDVFFASDQGDPCGDVFAVARHVDAADPVTGALEALLAGPTAAERAQGYGGLFSDATAGLLRGVRVEDGTAWADFTDLPQVIPNASTSCGSAGLLAQLDSTLLRFATVSDTRYSLDGDVDAFYGWLQLVTPAGPTTAPERTDLPDGRHAVFLHAIDVDAGTLTVDVVQFLTGQAAADAYRRDHPEDPDGPPNDYYIVNENPRLRTLTVAGSLHVRLVRLEETGTADLEDATWLELPGYFAPWQEHDLDGLHPNPFWVTLVEGLIVGLEEQYLP